MPRYFFDIINGGDPALDQFGVILADDGEARDEAVALLSEMARTSFPVGDQHEYLTKARNEDGEIVYEASLNLSGRWWPGQPR